jgi:hypothetical protein
MHHLAGHKDQGCCQPWMKGHPSAWCTTGRYFLLLLHLMVTYVTCPKGRSTTLSMFEEASLMQLCTFRTEPVWDYFSWDSFSILSPDCKNQPLHLESLEINAWFHYTCTCHLYTVLSSVMTTRWSDIETNYAWFVTNTTVPPLLIIISWMQCLKMNWQVCMSIADKGKSSMWSDVLLLSSWHSTNKLHQHSPIHFWSPSAMILKSGLSAHAWLQNLAVKGFIICIWFSLQNVVPSPFDHNN